LTVEAAGERVTMEAASVEKARTKAVTLGEIIEHVGRLGGSGYHPAAWDAEAGIGYSALHSIRRVALERLDSVRLAPWSGRERRAPTLPRLVSHGVDTDAPSVVAVVWDEGGAAACVEAGADAVLLRMFGGADSAVIPTGAHPLLPRVMSDRDVHMMADLTCDGSATVGNLGALSTLPEGCRAGADWPLNVLNPWTAAELHEFGAGFVWASPELSGRQPAMACASPGTARLTVTST
jgi:hypothetical protein